MDTLINRLRHFLDATPTPYHCVQNLTGLLDLAGYSQLREQDSWGGLAEGKYYLTRNDSSLIAFKLCAAPEKDGFRLVGAHTDSPCLKIKPNAVTVNNGYAKLGVEVYGGVLLNPWFDRDLAIAGRVTVRNKKGAIENILINVDQPVAFIPSLAIHLDREANESRSINKQKHLPAVLCRTDKGDADFNSILQGWIKQQGLAKSAREIMAYELSLYDHQRAALVGMNQEFLASARLDNLLSCFASTEALLTSNNKCNQMIVLNDHEEVGSGSTSGAEGSFLHSVLCRICGNQENMQRGISHSMLISADNAHGVHPNFVDVHEPMHQPLINNGPVIKTNSNQRYATNSETAGVFRAACEASKVPYQQVVVRTDMGCGSTIGPITATRIGVRTVDIGVPQLGMHSIRELAGVADQQYLVDGLKGFFELENWPF